VIFRALSAVNLNLAAVALNKLLCNKQTVPVPTMLRVVKKASNRLRQALRVARWMPQAEQESEVSGDTVTDTAEKG